MFRSLTVSLLLVSLALLGLAALPAYPRTDTASVQLDPTELETPRTLLGESPDGEKAEPGRQTSANAGSGGTMTLSVPKLGLEDVAVPTADSQVALDEEGIIHLKDSGVPWQQDSNTVIVGHAIGFPRTKLTYVFYELDKMEPGDEIVVRDGEGKEYVYEVYDRMTVQPEDYWVTYPEPGSEIISLQTCTPIPTFENRLVVRGELVS
jgi:sortase A